MIYQEAFPIYSNGVGLLVFFKYLGSIMALEELKKAFENTTTAIGKDAEQFTKGFKKTVYSFFKPYNDVYDVVWTPVQVVAAPIVFAALTGFLGIVTALCSLASVATALLGGAAYCFNEEIGTKILAAAVSFTLQSLTYAAFTVACAILTLVSGPSFFASFFTRTGATLAEQFDCCEPDDAEVPTCCM